MKKLTISAALAALLFAGSLAAAPVTYDFHWTGDAGVSVEGSFTFEQELASSSMYVYVESYYGSTWIDGMDHAQMSIHAPDGSTIASIDSAEPFAEESLYDDAWLYLNFDAAEERLTYLDFSYYGDTYAYLYSSGDWTDMYADFIYDSGGALNVGPAAVPAPTALPLLLSALGLLGIARRRRA